MDQDEAALALFAVAAASDALDGAVARRRGTTARGAFLDPLADKILVGGALAPLAATARVDATLAIALAAREAIALSARVTDYRRGRQEPASRTAKVKTALQMSAIVLALLAAPRVATDATLAAALALGLLSLPRRRPSPDALP